MIHVAVPYRDRPDLTLTLLEDLAGEYDRLWLMDNGSTPATRKAIRDAVRGDRRVDVSRHPDAHLTGMWNWAWLSALDTPGEVTLILLNNDIRVPAGFTRALDGALRADPRLWVAYPDYRRRVADGVNVTGVTYTTGTYRHGGLCGWAFAVKAEAHHAGLPLMDEQFAWWGSDDDLVFSVERRGYRVGRVDGLPVDHVGSATFNTRDLHRQAHDDLQRVIAKWGR